MEFCHLCSPQRGAQFPNIWFANMSWGKQVHDLLDIARCLVSAFVLVQYMHAEEEEWVQARRWPFLEQAL